MVQQSRKPNYLLAGEVTLCRQRVRQWVACQEVASIPYGKGLRDPLLPFARCRAQEEYHCLP